MGEPIVVIENLVKTYKTGDETLSILDDVSFAVERGTSVSISGRSGSGKSTLLNILGGLDRYDSGRVLCAGENLGALSETALSAYRAARVGFVFQFHYLLKDFTALENVMLPAYMAGVPKKKAVEKAKKLLEAVGMSERSSHLPGELSGGERQRTAVARSLINDPDLVLADEPTGNLDSHSTQSVAELLYKSVENSGKTLIVVTHDGSVASRAQRCYTLSGGKLELLDHKREPSM